MTARYSRSGKTAHRWRKDSEDEAEEAEAEADEVEEPSGVGF